MLQAERIKRDEVICYLAKLLGKDISLKTIGERFNITRERVRQILQANDVKKADRRNRPTGHHCVKCGALYNFPAEGSRNNCPQHTRPPTILIHKICSGCGLTFEVMQAPMEYRHLAQLYESLCP